MPGDSVTVVFEATLAPVIQSGTAVLNRAQLTGDDSGLRDEQRDLHPDRLRAGLRGLEDLPGSHRRPLGPAGRRHPALHPHGEKHRQRKRRQRRAAGSDPGQHDLRGRQHDPERRPGGRPGGRRLAPAGRPCGPCAGGSDGRCDARRRHGHHRQCGDGHLRCRHQPRRGRRGDHLQPGLRQRRRRRQRPGAPEAVRRSGHARSRTTRPATSWAMCRWSMPTRRCDPGRRAARPASSIPATCCATPSPSATRERLRPRAWSSPTRSPPTRPMSPTRSG